MGSRQECGCKLDFTFWACVYVFQLKCESKMLVFFNTMFLNLYFPFLIAVLSSNFNKQEPVSYGVAAVSFLNSYFVYY